MDINEKQQGYGNPSKPITRTPRKKNLYPYNNWKVSIFTSINSEINKETICELSLHH